MAIDQPYGIVVIPNQAVTADLHCVDLSETDSLVCRCESKVVGGWVNRLPLQRIFRFDHVEFARESGGVGWFGEEGRTNGSAD